VAAADEGLSHTSLAALVRAGLLDEAAAAACAPVVERYAVAVTPEVAGTIRAGAHGVAAQFLPTERELQVHPAELRDPIGDGAHSPVAGIVHRHADRVLFKIVNVCPVYCRFCFRREMVGPGRENQLDAAAIQTALGYIAEHHEIREVIFTGGDPFVLSPRRIRDVVAQIADIPHVVVLRWHTRVPVVGPTRITEELVGALTSGRKATFVAIHANHADEFTLDARRACRRLIDGGVSLVSQSVLLRGVNDDIDTLAELMETFVVLGIKPYYLHHGDLAPGTAHFRVSIAFGLRLVDELRQRVSGLCQPTYVLDLPGGFGKVPLDSQAVRAIGPGCYEIRDGDGRVHVYRDALEPEAGAQA
jgi:lysine 2,3-aminomutase